VEIQFEIKENRANEILPSFISPRRVEFGILNSLYYTPNSHFYKQLDLLPFSLELLSWFFCFLDTKCGKADV